MIRQENEMMRDDWLRIYNVATRNSACTKKSTSTPLVNPLWWDHLLSISITEGSNDSDAFSTNLPAGVFDPKLTVGQYAVGGGVPRLSFQVVTVGYSRDCGRAQDGRMDFSDCTKQNQRDGQDVDIGCSCSSMLKGTYMGVPL